MGLGIIWTESFSIHEHITAKITEGIVIISFELNLLVYMNTLVWKSQPRVSNMKEISRWNKLLSKKKSERKSSAYLRQASHSYLQRQISYWVHHFNTSLIWMCFKTDEGNNLLVQSFKKSYRRKISPKYVLIVLTAT